VTAPKGRPLPYVDTHCHLEHHFDLSVAEQVERARSADVTTLITVGTDVATSREAVATAQQFDGVYAAVGIHPNDAGDATPEALEQIGHLAAQPGVVAVGETGLDYYRDWATPPQQDAAFRAHIELAKSHDRTLVIHCREAWPDCLAVLEDQGPPDRVVMHCFSGDPNVVAHCVERGWFLSYAGNVTFANASTLQASAVATPLDLLLTETDSPYLTPHPHRGKPNDPSYLPHTVRFLAELLDCPVGQVAEVVLGNARRAFALPPEQAGDPT
jgi:TatD DNase family protein